MSANHPLRPRNWTIILNPVAGRGQGRKIRPRLERALSRSEGTDFSWQIFETSTTGEAEQIALERAAAYPHEGIAAAGGDGTLSDVVNGILQSGNPVVAGLVPVGTGNDFAREWLQNLEIENAVLTLKVGSPRAIDVGHLKNGATAGRYFINVAGCGFDAAVAQRINEGIRALKGTPAYVAAVLQTLARFRPVSLGVTYDDTHRSQRALLCAIANSTGYGGGMRIAPQARPDDGLLEICLIGDAGRIEFLRAFPSVFRGDHIAHPKVTMLRGRKIEIESESPLPVLIDGELCGTTPFEITIQPGALWMMARPEAAESSQSQRPPDRS